MNVADFPALALANPQATTAMTIGALVVVTYASAEDRRGRCAVT